MRVVSCRIIIGQFCWSPTIYLSFITTIIKTQQKKYDTSEKYGIIALSFGDKLKNAYDSAVAKLGLFWNKWYFSYFWCFIRDKRVI